MTALNNAPDQAWQSHWEELAEGGKVVEPLPSCEDRASHGDPGLPNQAPPREVVSNVIPGAQFNRKTSVWV